MAVAVENNLAIMEEGEQVSDAMERLERKIDKEIAKPEYCMGPKLKATNIFHERELPEWGARKALMKLPRRINVTLRVPAVHQHFLLIFLSTENIVITIDCYGEETRRERRLGQDMDETSCVSVFLDPSMQYHGDKWYE